MTRTTVQVRLRGRIVAMSRVTRPTRAYLRKVGEHLAAGRRRNSGVGTHTRESGIAPIGPRPLVAGYSVSDDWIGIRSGPRSDASSSVKQTRTPAAPPPYTESIAGEKSRARLGRGKRFIRD